MDKNKISNFSNLLLQWSKDNVRELPWKKSKNPYNIWLSEIILQQTRVAQGLPYYEKFVTNFPTINDLAKAKEDKVLKLWEGLGYYSRARNLHFTAKEIVRKYGGIFPKTYEEIASLKGIGPYTTAAIMSFAYDKPYPVLDGNVFRIVSRYTGSFEAIDVQKNHAHFYAFLNQVIDRKNPGEFNQAMMDLGSKICTPKKYQCTYCPLQQNCVAFKDDLQALLPNKIKQLSKKDRYFHYLEIATPDGKFFIEKRELDIWKGLYQLPVIEKESEKQLQKIEVKKWLSDLQINPKKLVIREIIKQEKHILTHQNINSVFYKIDIDEVSFQELTQYFILVSQKNLSKYAFPKLILKYLSL